MVVADAPAGAGGPPVPWAADMPGMYGSTTVDIVLHNSMDYYISDIGSNLFLHPFEKGAHHFGEPAAAIVGI